VETAREKDGLILRREEEIERMKAKMADMAAEFGDMLAGACCAVGAAGAACGCAGRGSMRVRVACVFGQHACCGRSSSRMRVGGRLRVGRAMLAGRWSVELCACTRCRTAAPMFRSLVVSCCLLQSRPHASPCRSGIAETLRKMGERVELSAASWEGESASGVPLIRRMEEYAAGGAGGGGGGKP